MVTGENFKLSPGRQLPAAIKSGTLHVSFEDGICGLFRGHLTPCSLAPGSSCLYLTRQFPKAGEPKVCASRILSVVEIDMKQLWSELRMTLGKNLDTLNLTKYPGKLDKCIYCCEFLMAEILPGEATVGFIKDNSNQKHYQQNYLTTCQVLCRVRVNTFINF